MKKTLFLMPMLALLLLPGCAPVSGSAPAAGAPELVGPILCSCPGTQAPACAERASSEAAPPPSPEAAAEAYVLVHTVGPGDSLWKLSRRYGVAIDELVEFNGLRDRSYIRLGQQIRIPIAADNESAPATVLEAAPETETGALGEELLEDALAYGSPQAD